jgi:trans-aconitate methyltransferase
MTEWCASDYSRQSSLQQAMAEEQLALLTLQGDECILDVGCGDGKITAEIASRVPRGCVLGVDPSDDMIKFASNHFDPGARSNLRFEVADARRLSYQQEFDLIVSFNALHWVPAQEEALTSIGAALKPDGRAMLRLVPRGQRKSLETVIEDVRSRPRWASYFGDFRTPYVHFTPREYRDLAEHAGLRVVDLTVQDKAWDFKTREAFQAFGHATFVEWTRHVPAGLWPKFIADVLDAYRAVAANRPDEANTFKFYQMQVTLEPGQAGVE